MGTHHTISTHQYHERLELAGPTSSQQTAADACHVCRPTTRPQPCHQATALPLLLENNSTPSAFGQPNTLVLACPWCAGCVLLPARPAAVKGGVSAAVVFLREGAPPPPPGVAAQATIQVGSQWDGKVSPPVCLLLPCLYPSALTGPPDVSST